MSIELVMPSSYLILCHPLLLLPSISPSIRVFSNESVLHIRWPKYWSFRFSTSPSNEHPGLISFRMDWLDLLVVQGTLKSLFQHHSSKASILRCSAFFIVQLYRLKIQGPKQKSFLLSHLNICKYTAFDGHGPHGPTYSQRVPVSLPVVFCYHWGVTLNLIVQHDG